MCKSAIAHRTPKKVPHACTPHTRFRMLFARTFVTHPLDLILWNNYNSNRETIIGIQKPTGKVRKDTCFLIYFMTIMIISELNNK